MAIYALIPAAGTGSRLGGLTPKQYQEVCLRPMLEYCLHTFAAVREIAQIAVVISADDLYFDRLDLPSHVKHVTRALRVGGATRHESVLNGLQQWKSVCADSDWVMVHDAARPGLTPDLVSRLIEALDADPVGGLLALPIADTIKREVGGVPGHQVAHTVPRSGLWAAQTPQMFRYGILLRALEQAYRQGYGVTDEASAVEALGMQPQLVLGSARNFKVTYPDDLDMAAQILKGRLS